MADRIMTFKMAVRSIAKRHGLHATFMPKPRSEVNGSGMHIHFSLYKTEGIFLKKKGRGRTERRGFLFRWRASFHSREWL